ncbi:hypothetical protein XaplCFBP3122_06240 [Xanthomonas arboricola pv. populi]|uniref:Aerotolerance regulator N-terminal domain-containing protein n=1 Tax=Xanthomonas arboricola pv. populi TaxID=487823 RepID=A0A2S6Z7G8_9XANT|nr:hypothetical protein [Xanthomonas arboricola]PPT77553.1 hypothetical protein XaplCFBP3122_06240 [Xanthomonas arboricola pv. populi]
MNFAHAPFAAVAAGALLLAAALYALQRLKARRRAVSLPAAMLWQQVAGQTPPRVLGRRFRYWWAYLLSLAIVLALWLAAAAPRPDAAADTRRQVFYLDASAWMSAGDDFADARQALLADVAAVPAPAREVRLGDPHDSALLLPGEPLALLGKRLDGVRAAVHPSGFGRWMAAAGARAAADAGPVVHYYGAAPVARRAAAQLPPQVELVPGYLSRPLAGNRGIVNLGVAAAGSGRWDRVDVLVETAATGLPAIAAGGLGFSLDGRPWQPPAMQAAGPGRLLLKDVPAAGAELRVALREGDDFSADDSAGIRLPRRQRIKVALGEGVPPAIGELVALDPALEQVPAAQAQVLVRLADDAGQADPRPALSLTRADSQPGAFVFGVTAEDEQRELADNLQQLGLSQAQNAVLASRLDRAVGVDLVPAPQRSVAVWRELFEPGSDFAQSRAMPLFVSQSLRWLAQPPPWSPFAQAGRPLLTQAGLQGLSQDRQLLARGLGDAVYLPAAGHFRLGEQQLAVSLLDRDISAGVAAPAEPAEAARARAFAGALAADWAVWLLLAAVALLALEWWLLQRGRMP